MFGIVVFSFFHDFLCCYVNVNFFNFLFQVYFDSFTQEINAFGIMGDSETQHNKLTLNGPSDSDVWSWLTGIGPCGNVTLKFDVKFVNSPAGGRNGGVMLYSNSPTFRDDTDIKGKEERGREETNRETKRAVLMVREEVEAERDGRRGDTIRDHTFFRFAFVSGFTVEWNETSSERGYYFKGYNPATEFPARIKVTALILFSCALSYALSYLLSFLCSSFFLLFLSFVPLSSSRYLGTPLSFSIILTVTFTHSHTGH